MHSIPPSSPRPGGNQGPNSVSNASESAPVSRSVAAPTDQDITSRLKHINNSLKTPDNYSPDLKKRLDTFITNVLSAWRANPDARKSWTDYLSDKGWQETVPILNFVYDGASHDPSAANKGYLDTLDKLAKPMNATGSDSSSEADEMIRAREHAQNLKNAAASEPNPDPTSLVDTLLEGTGGTGGSVLDLLINPLEG